MTDLNPLEAEFTGFTRHFTALGVAMAVPASGER
jgi:hypothetical protein